VAVILAWAVLHWDWGGSCPSDLVVTPDSEAEKNFK